VSDDLRARIRAALLAVNHPYEPDELARIPDSQSVAARVGDLVDVVMAVLDEAFPPQFALAPGQVSDAEMARLHRLWLQAQADSTGGLVILPPNASDLWRRYTPEQRRDWLTAHRDDAIERGIPGDLVDLMIRDAEPEDEITGYPDHLIVNGDHSGCPCGGEAP
jgi:hypothetical protein